MHTSAGAIAEKQKYRGDAEYADVRIFRVGTLRALGLCGAEMTPNSANSGLFGAILPCRFGSAHFPAVRSFGTDLILLSDAGIKSLSGDLDDLG